MTNTHTFAIKIEKKIGIIAIQCLKCNHYFNFVDGYYSKWNNILTCDELIIKSIIQ